MRRRLSAVLGAAGLLLALASSPSAAEQPAQAGWTPVVLPDGMQRDLQSVATGLRYRIFVSVPEGPAPAAGYPVIYVLDGNAAFPTLALMNRSVDRRSQRTGIGAAVVVGIGYASGEDFDVAGRARDYTPPAGAQVPSGQGGAEQFLDFIEQELKPLIAASHPIDPARQAIFGHSFGGLLVLHALFTRPAAFSTFLAASPSIWWQEQFILGELPALAERSAALPALPRVMISVGEREDDLPRGKLSPELLATLAKRPMVDAARRLAATLQGQAGWSEQVTFHLLAGEDHGSAWFPALSRALTIFLQ